MSGRTNEALTKTDRQSDERNKQQRLELSSWETAAGAQGGRSSERATTLGPHNPSHIRTDPIQVQCNFSGLSASLSQLATTQQLKDLTANPLPSIGHLCSASLIALFQLLSVVQVYMVL